MQRLDEVNRFYEILHDLEDRLGGKRCLADCHGKMEWPRRGIYFFFEAGENRSPGHGPRVVRIGTHALKRGAKTTLWDRLRAHRGTLSGMRAGGGNHRGSIFRRHVGTAILRREGLEKRYPKWGVGSSAPRKIRDAEQTVEKVVSQHIRAMPFLWTEVDDAQGPKSQRAYFERNLIALLSNYGKLRTPGCVDPPSRDWLGFDCTSAKVCQSGLWNADHVTEERWAPSLLDEFDVTVRRLNLQVRRATRTWAVKEST